MNRILLKSSRALLPGLLVLTVTSCKEPQAVEVLPQDFSEQADVNAIAEADTGLAVSAVDSTALLPADRYLFEGFLQVSRVVWDAGPTRAESIAVARAYFSDRRKPVLRFGRIVGYYGLDMGAVLINGNLMFRRSYCISSSSGVIDTAGFEYVRDLTSIYKPNTQYTWTVGVPGVGLFTSAIESPDNLMVLTPRGGNMLSRDQDLVVRWTGKGDFSLVISLIDPLRKNVPKPLLHIVPAANQGKILLSSKVLRLLPPNRAYWFSFLLLNRKDLSGVSQYAGRILVQSAYVYNAYVEFR